MSTKFYFISFGDSNKFQNALNKIESEAKSLDIFDFINCCTEKNLDQEWFDKHKNFMYSNSRGFGYWIWKPKLIQQFLSKMNDGDILCYADSGCRLNIQGKERLLYYKKLAEESEFKNVSFPLKYNFNNKKTCHLEKTWTKKDVYNLFNLEGKEEAQLVGGIFLICKCKNTIDMVNKWLELAENYHYIDDSPSIEKNDVLFKEHRHDQSLWSIVRKQYGTTMLEEDETYYENFNNHLDKPIHAIRRR